jgi:hypothetical protein
MRWFRLMLAGMLGCGRIGFEVCAACDSHHGTIDVGNGVQRVQVAEPGSLEGTMLEIPLHVRAGDLLLVAAYSHNSEATVSDSQGSTWNTLPGENQPCGAGQVGVFLRFWYAVAAGGADTIEVQTINTQPLGAFVIEYAGIDPTTPVDDAGGDVGGAASATLDAGTLTITGPDAVVALFGENSDPGTLQPGAGLSLVAHDDAFDTLAAETPASSGSVTPTAMLDGGASVGCWAGASVALRAR